MATPGLAGGPTSARVFWSVVWVQEGRGVDGMRRAALGKSDLRGICRYRRKPRCACEPPGTENLIMDLLDEPRTVNRLSKRLTKLWLEYYRRLYRIIEQTGRGTTPWAHIWSSGACYMLQSDISYMLSPEYARPESCASSTSALRGLGRSYPSWGSEGRCE